LVTATWDTGKKVRHELKEHTNIAEHGAIGIIKKVRALGIVLVHLPSVTATSKVL